MHGLVALGRESASLWPRLVLGYAALAEGDWAAVLVHATHAVAANPDHLEAGIMQAIALAHLGRADEAAERMRSMHADGHLRWHLAHRQGHPMEQLADAVLAAGLTISDAAPQLTPLVPVPVP
jgi:alkyl sulfatase BDS1-like metallo-beta-lactamase superfamily hydrolase